MRKNRSKMSQESIRLIKKNISYVVAFNIILIASLTLVLSLLLTQRQNLDTKAQQTVICTTPGGCGGLCKWDQNSGCGFGGCRRWEYCGSTGTCIDTTNRGTNPATAQACGDKVNVSIPVGTSMPQPTIVKPSINPQNPPNLTCDDQNWFCLSECATSETRRVFNNNYSLWRQQKIEFTNRDHGTHYSSCSEAGPVTPQQGSTPYPTSIPTSIPTATRTPGNPTAIPTVTQKPVEGCLYMNVTYPKGFCTITSTEVGVGSNMKVFLYCDKSNSSSSTDGWVQEKDGIVCQRYSKDGISNTACIANGYIKDSRYNCCSGSVNNNVCNSISVPTPTVPIQQPTITVFPTKIPTISPTRYIPYGTPLPTSTRTPTPTLTRTPTSRPTYLPTLTPSPTRTITPTRFNTQIPTNSPIPTMTPFPTSVPTFTPSPTRMNVPTATPYRAQPTVTYTPTPTAMVIVPPAGRRCSDYGLGLFNPQMRLLGRELCTGGRLVDTFSADYVPPNLVSIQDEFIARGIPYIGKANTYIRSEVVGDLGRLVFDMYNKYKDDPNQGCLPYIAHGYRDYYYQKQIYDQYDCVWDDALQTNVIRGTKDWCGVARPGSSLHQAGLALDIYCTKVTKDGNNYKLEPDYNKKMLNYAENVIQDYGFNHPIPDDPPHYHYFR